MADENVVAFTPGASIESDRRASFLNMVAAVFDNYAASQDGEPDAIVFVLGGVRQPIVTSYSMKGDSLGCATALMTMAGTRLLAEAFDT